MLKRTPLYEIQLRRGAKFVPFGDWELPVQYSNIMEEHLAARRAAGVFDISHMGEITVSGTGAARFLNETLANDIDKLSPGTGQYTFLCNERGGVIDDLYAFRLSEEVYLLIVNASRTQVDVQWLQGRVGQVGSREMCCSDASHQYAALAVQGPLVKEFIDRCIPGAASSGMRVGRVSDLQKNQIAGFPFGHANVLVARTGYTGEDGFEITGRDESIVEIWGELLRAGQPFGIRPCGLGARDTLRTEVCYPLYGHELDENTTPIEAGLGFFVSLDKGEFIGRGVLAEQKAEGTGRKLVAFKMTGKSAPPRPSYPIWIDGRQVGQVTSGTQSPSLGIGIGMGYVPSVLAGHGQAIEIEIRGKRAPAVLVKKPIYRPSVMG